MGNFTSKFADRKIGPKFSRAILNRSARLNLFVVSNRIGERIIWIHRINLDEKNSSSRNLSAMKIT